MRNWKIVTLAAQVIKAELRRQNIVTGKKTEGGFIVSATGIGSPHVPDPARMFTPLELSVANELVDFFMTATKHEVSVLYEEVAIAASKEFSEASAAVETITFLLTIQRHVQDVVSASEAVTSNTGKQIVDNSSSTESVTRVWGAARGFTEVSASTSTLLLILGKTYNELATSASLVSFHLVKLLEEIVSSAEDLVFQESAPSSTSPMDYVYAQELLTFVMDAIRAVNELATSDETLSKSPFKVMSDVSSSSLTIQTQTSKVLAEIALTTEVLTSVLDFARLLNESSSSADTLSLDVGRLSSDQVVSTDEATKAVQRPTQESSNNNEVVTAQPSKVIPDVITSFESRTAFHNNYAGSYFAEQYVGTTINLGA